MVEQEEEEEEEGRYRYWREGEGIFYSRKGYIVLTLGLSGIFIRNG